MRTKVFAYHAMREGDYFKAFDLTYPTKTGLSVKQKEKCITKLLQDEEMDKYRTTVTRIEMHGGSIKDIEKELITIINSSVLDFLTVTPDSLGIQTAVFRPSPGADLRNVKSLKISKNGDISIVMYDRLEALKALYVIKRAEEGAETGGYVTITDSLNKLMKNVTINLNGRGSDNGTALLTESNVT